jgi:plastocyanin
MRRVKRRAVLAAVAAGTGTVAGCLTGGGGTDETTTPSDSGGTDMTTRETTTAETTTGETTTGETTTGGTAEETTTSGGASVVMSQRSFSPRVLSIDPGTTVTWTNTDTYGHDVTSARFHDEAESWDFQTDTVPNGDAVSYAFEDAGVYEYYCTVHGRTNMCGAVLVGGASLPSDLPCSGGYG